MRAKKPEGRQTVEPSLGDRLVASFAEFRDVLASGEPLENHLVVRRLKADLEPTRYGPGEIKAVRDKLKASQALLASFLGVSVTAVSSWEQGSRPVPKIACRYLDDIQEFPDLWTRRLKKANLTPVK